MQKTISLFFILFSLLCFPQKRFSDEKRIDYVNPFIGTGGHGPDRKSVV